MASIKTLKQLRDNIASTIRDTQISTIIDSYINLTLTEILTFHQWTFLRRKADFDTVADQEDYYLDEEIDKLAVIRETESDNKLIYVPDQDFYKVIPDPTATGYPRYYRLWEEVGVLAQLSADGTVYVKSSSASDTTSFKVSVVGRDANGLVVSEVLTCNGTTAVTSTTTFSAILQVSKSAVTTGTITLYATTGDGVLSRIAPEEIAPRYKKISMYPIPSAVITMYVEYFERIRTLENDTDVPQLDHKWIWVLREGSLAKAWGYKQNEQAALLSHKAFKASLNQMKREDSVNPDFIPHLRRHAVRYHSNVHRVSDSIGDEEPVYVVSP